jgi:hypothetical protein
MSNEPHYEPPECDNACIVRNCPYSHVGAWFVGDQCFGTDEEAAREASDALMSALTSPHYRGTP